MSKNSMTISNCAIDRVHIATTTKKREKLIESICHVTRSDSFESIEPSGHYREAIKFNDTGILVKWNELIEGNKNPQNGKVLCTIAGEWLKEQDLQQQLIIPLFLGMSYSISQLDLKFQLNNPEFPIAGIQEMTYQAGLDKYPQIDYKGADGFINHTSGWKSKQHRSDTIEFVNAKHDKSRLVIYDPFEKHKIANAQHWELRLKGTYIEPVLKKLTPNRKNIELSSRLITDLILGSIEFTWDGKTMAWYKRVKEAPLII